MPIRLRALGKEFGYSFFPPMISHYFSFLGPSSLWLSLWISPSHELRQLVCSFFSFYKLLHPRYPQLLLQTGSICSIDCHCLELHLKIRIESQDNFMTFVSSIRSKLLQWGFKLIPDEFFKIIMGIMSRTIDQKGGTCAIKEDDSKDI